MPRALSISQVSQDVTLLSGDDFVQGVVAATDGGDAIHASIAEMERHRDEWESEDPVPPAIHPARLRTRGIGIAADGTPHEVFAMVYGHDDGVS